MGNCIKVSISCDASCSSCRDSTVRKKANKSQLSVNLDALQIALNNLVEAKSDVEKRTNFAEETADGRRQAQVQSWLSRAQVVETEVGELIMRYESQVIGNSCIGGFCSMNGKSSSKFEEDVIKLLQVVAALKVEGDLNEVAEEVPEASLKEKPNESIQSIFDEVWKCLNLKQGGIIGLYGTGTVEKTTLLSQINSKLHETPNGFVVMWILVSEDLQYEKIQEKIRRQMSIFDESWQDKSLEERARHIFRILSKKKFVLLIDDIWERVDLMKVGIPLPNSKFASKIVFTTHSVEICRHMEAHNQFKVECLRYDELFQSKVRDTLHDKRHVTENGGHLSLALITVDQAMAFRTTSEDWKYANHVLSRSITEFPGMMKEEHSLLQFCSGRLPSEIIRSCFSSFSSFLEENRNSKTELKDCWIGEGISEDRNGSQNQGYRIIGHILQACLCKEEGFLANMLDEIPSMVLWMAKETEKEKENFFIHASATSTSTPMIGGWEGMRKMLVMENQIDCIMETPTWSHLLTDLFLNNNHLKMMSSDFFQFMASHKVLNLSYDPFLTESPSQFHSIEHLDLSGCAIEELPKELQILVKLKCLNLEHTTRLHTIPRDVISKFVKLRVLRILDCGSLNEATKDSVLSNDGELLMEELLCLKDLKRLSITMKSLNALQRFLNSHELLHCTHSLCLRSIRHRKLLPVPLAHLKNLDTLYIKDCKYLEELKIDCARGVKTIRGPCVFHSLQDVSISSCSKLRDLTWLIYAPNLKRILISYCSGMKEIISGENLGEFPEIIGCLIPFQELEFVELQHLPNLQSIFWDSLPLQHLKEIRVNGCPKLKKLPLDCNSVQEQKIVITGEKRWWEKLQWEDQETQNAFRPCFKSFW